MTMLLKLLRRGLLLLLAGALLYLAWLFAWVVYWEEHNPTTTSFIELRRAELQARSNGAAAGISQRWLPYEQISPHLKRALIASEDAKFVDHAGFDWQGIQSALEKNARRGRSVAGGSTISQQLAKNLFLTPQRSLLRKGEEALITVLIEARWSKRRIFEVYLNVIEWGDGVFGAEAAARHYFASSAGALGPAEAAFLAALVPAPRYYDKNRRAPGLARKSAIIAGRMAQARIP